MAGNFSSCRAFAFLLWPRFLEIWPWPSNLVQTMAALRFRQCNAVYKKNNFPDILKQDKCYSARQLYLCVTCRKPAHQLLVPKLSSGRTNTQRPTARPGPLKWSVKRNPRDVLTQRQSNTVNWTTEANDSTIAYTTSFKDSDITKYWALQNQNSLNWLEKMSESRSFLTFTVFHTIGCATRKVPGSDLQNVLRLILRLS